MLHAFYLLSCSDKHSEHSSFPYLVNILSYPILSKTIHIPILDQSQLSIIFLPKKKNKEKKQNKKLK